MKKLASTELVFGVTKSVKISGSLACVVLEMARIKVSPSKRITGILDEVAMVETEIANKLFMFYIWRLCRFN